MAVASPGAVPAAQTRRFPLAEAGASGVMRIALLLVLPLLLPHRVAAAGALPAPYHTSEEILAEFREMASGGGCPGANLKLTQTVEDTVSLTVATFAAKGAGGVSGSGGGPDGGNGNDDRPRDRAFVLFGEHARELISPETALRMALDLCGTNEKTAALARKVLERTDVTMVPIANPLGRTSVEGGAFCQRVNENGVDLNRNWDAHWQASSESGGADTNPGSAPFSEPETRILKRLVDTLRPDVFITVHSGTLGMYMPYAYSRDLPNNDPTDLDRMTRILNALNPTYCRCPSGPAGKDVGYLCPGTCLDYAYEHHASISFAFEIYAPDADKIHADFEAGKEASPDWDGQARRHRVVGTNLLPSSLAASASFPPRFSSFLQSAQASSARLEAEQLHGSTARSREDCFKFFNPSSQEEYDETTQCGRKHF